MVQDGHGGTQIAEDISAQCTIVAKASPQNHCNVIVRLRFNKYHPGGIHCDLTCSDADEGLFKNFIYPNQIGRIEGRLLTGEKITIKPPYSLNCIQAWNASMEVDEFTCGHVDKIPFDRGKVKVKVTIPHTPVAVLWGMTQSSYIGLVKKKTKGRPIRWRGTRGSFVLGDFYEYEAGRTVGVDGSLLRIQRCQIFFEDAFTSPIQPIDLISQVETELEDILTVLSLLSRRPLPWYELNVTFIPDSDDYNIVSVRKRRSVYLKKPLPESNFLASQRALSIGGVFSRMLHRYKKLQHKEVIKSVIDFQIASYQYDLLEARAVLLYSGEEALINGLSGETTKLPPKLFKNLRTEIEKTIDNYLKGKFKDKTGEINALKGQLGNLNQKHWINKLLQLSKYFRVPVHQLWPEGKDPEDGFKEINRRRAALLHRGIVQDGDLLSRDITRLSAFLELFILRLLGFPLKKIHPVAHELVRELVNYESIEHWGSD